MDKFRDEVGKNRTVFDVAAGYGRIAKFIDPSNSYYGIDLNEIFVNHGRKNGLNLEVRNIFDPDSYKLNDVFVLVDVIHHLTKEQLERLFDLIFQHAGIKVVIIEPSFVNLALKYGIFGKLVDRFFKIMDYDGFNRINRWFTNEEYQKLFEQRFGSRYGEKFSVSQDIIANHYLVSFSKN